MTPDDEQLESEPEEPFVPPYERNGYKQRFLVPKRSLEETYRDLNRRRRRAGLPPVKSHKRPDSD